MRFFKSFKGQNKTALQLSSGLATVAGVMAVQNAARAEVINGTENGDHIIGSEERDVIYGLGGDDLIEGAEGADWLSGGDGDDRIYGEREAEESDTPYLPDNRPGTGDWIFGGNGDDRLFGRKGNDMLFGGEGDDVINGGSGHDVIVGGIGNDTMKGGADNDALYGGAGQDLMYGQDGNDSLDGGDDDDIIYGGDGTDKFVITIDRFFNPEIYGNGAYFADTVSDFEDGIDMLVFDAADDADTSSLAAVGLTVTDQDGRAVIRYDNYDLVELRFISADDITVADFEFV